MTTRAPTTRITAHGCEITEADRDRAEGLARRWPRFDPAVMDVHFVFQPEGRSCCAEAIVSRPRREPVVAKGAGPTFRGALDELDQHVKRILARDRKRRKEFRPPPEPGASG